MCERVSESLPRSINWRTAVYTQTIRNALARESLKKTKHEIAAFSNTSPRFAFHIILHHPFFFWRAEAKKRQEWMSLVLPTSLSSGHVEGDNLAVSGQWQFGGEDLASHSHWATSDLEGLL